MPDGQMAGLTAQEAADLLEYLATRKSGATTAAQPADRIIAKPADRIPAP